ncbi:MAG: hypothetical protein U0793_27080 [Gemmataceae bacterium]
MDQSRFSLDALLANGNGNGVLHAEKETPANAPREDAAAAKPQAGGAEGGGGARAEGAASPRRLEDSPAGLDSRAGLRTGNPYNRRVARLKWALLDAAPEEKITAIGEKLVQLALEGNVAAARVLFTYVLPKGVEPDRVNMDEWEGYRKEQRMEEEMRPIMKSLEPEFALDIVRMLRPAASAGKAALMGEVLRTGSMDVFSSPEKLRTVVSGGAAPAEKGKKARRKAGKR